MQLLVALGRLSHLDQDLTRLIWRCDLAAQIFDNAADLGDLLGIAFRQLAAILGVTRDLFLETPKPLFPSVVVRKSRARRTSTGRWMVPVNLFAAMR